MHVTHAVERLLRELDRVLATDGHVPGVEAEANIAALEHHVDVVLGLHDRLHVGVQHLIESVLGADLIDDPEHLHHVPALVGVERARDRPVGIEDDGGDEFRRACPLEEICDATGFVDRPLAHRGIVKHDGGEATDERHVVLRELGLDVLGRCRQEAGRAELGSRQTQARHLGEHARCGEHRSPAGDFADAPGDGSGRDSVEEGGHGSPG